MPTFVFLHVDTTRSDRGAFPAEIRPPQGELLRPSPLSRAECVRRSKALSWLRRRLPIRLAGTRGLGPGLLCALQRSTQPLRQVAAHGAAVSACQRRSSVAVWPSRFAATRSRLGGMHESTARLPARPDGETRAALARAILRCLNMAVLDADHDADSGSSGGEAAGEVLFSAATLHSDQPVLLSLLPEPGGLKVQVHADDAMAGPLLLDEAKEALKLR